MNQMSRQFEYAKEKAAKSEYLGTTWPVFRNFRVEEEAVHGDDGVVVYQDVIARAPRRPAKLPEPKESGAWQRVPIDLLSEDRNLERIYAPLRDEPNLLLKFASLARKDDIGQDAALRLMLDWVESYGALGLDDGEGRWQSLNGFIHALRQAARCLTLYEAATAPNGPDIRTLEKYKADGDTPEEKKDWALEVAGDLVGDQLARECYPRLYREVSRKAGETMRFTQGWGFRSLLGAMYIQMSWLITEGNNAPRCKGPGCFRVIRIGELEQPPADPGLKKNARGKYRTRKDKVFCSRNCKEKWRYHYVLKPGR